MYYMQYYMLITSNTQLFDNCNHDIIIYGSPFQDGLKVFSAVNWLQSIDLYSR